MDREDIMQSCKDQLKLHIGMLLEQDIRRAYIEIELLHYMKQLIYADR
jgi:hypothetical protein